LTEQVRHPDNNPSRRILRKAAQAAGILAEVDAALAAQNNKVTDGSDWRGGMKSFGQLTTELPRFLLEGLVPEKALTAICAPSYNCKTWLALQFGFAISTGKDFFGFKGPPVPVPCRYHVPEMNEAFVRLYMAKIGFEESENFLVRPMESGLWPLNDARMIKSAEGCVNFYDTAGYFNPADDSASYTQSIRFAELIYNLLQHGALAVVGLFHPPKYAKDPSVVWSLENSILGSAGYAGILRSCLRMQNLNPDLNDPNVWVYVQGMKNPGLKPFQLEGPVPLKMKVPPGDSPYLKDLNLSEDPRKAQAFAGFKAGKTARTLTKELKCSGSTLTLWRDEWDKLQVVTTDQEEEDIAFSEGEANDRPN
jgi:AAA domain